MPPPVALLLCTAFVVWLLGYDRKQRGEISKAFWLPTIWMFSIATKPLAMWFGGGGVDAEAGSPMDRLFQSILLLLAFTVLQRRRLNWSEALSGNTWLFLLLAYMLISIAWSDIPYSSFKRWIREFTAVVMALLVLTERSPREAILSLFRRTTYILIPFSYVLIKYYPAYGRGYAHWSGKEAWMGVTMTKNCLGRLCMMTSIFLIWALIRRWKGRERGVARLQTYVDIMLLGLSLYLLRGAEGEAYSATSVAAMASGLVAYFGLAWMRKLHIPVPSVVLTLVLGVIVVIGVTTPLVGGGLAGTYATALGRDETLTSRTEIWENVMPYVRASPILGSGFGAFWTTGVQAVVGVNEAHNGYLEVLLNLGVVGLFLNCMLLLSFGWDGHKALSKDFDWGSLCICFVLVNVMYNFGEASMDSLTSHLTAMTFFLALTCQRAAFLSSTPVEPARTVSTGEMRPLAAAHSAMPFEWGPGPPA